MPSACRLRHCRPPVPSAIATLWTHASSQAGWKSSGPPPRVPSPAARSRRECRIGRAMLQPDLGTASRTASRAHATPRRSASRRPAPCTPPVLPGACLPRWLGRDGQSPLGRGMQAPWRLGTAPGEHAHTQRRRTLSSFRGHLYSVPCVGSTVSGSSMVTFAKVEGPESPRTSRLAAHAISMYTVAGRTTWPNTWCSSTKGGCFGPRRVRNSAPSTNQGGQSARRATDARRHRLPHRRAPAPPNSAAVRTDTSEGQRVASGSRDRSRASRHARHARTTWTSCRASPASRPALPAATAATRWPNPPHFVGRARTASARSDLREQTRRRSCGCRPTIDAANLTGWRRCRDQYTAHRHLARGKVLPVTFETNGTRGAWTARLRTVRSNSAGSLPSAASETRARRRAPCC